MSETPSKQAQGSPTPAPRDPPADKPVDKSNEKVGSLVTGAKRLIARLPHARDELLALLNGAVGDRLDTADASLALSMAMFVRDANARPPRLERADPALLASLPVKGRVVLMVHGLMGSQLAWTLGTGDAPGPAAELGEPVEYGGALADELGRSALYLRYNSGLHISENGQALTHMLESMLDTWPGGAQALQSIDIVAHSMGGLVTRSALHYGTLAGHAWVNKVGRVCLLGSPSHGAPLEQVAHVAAYTLETIWNPWTKLIGKAINLRAAGIKDLRHGFCIEEDWLNKDQDQLRLQKPRPTESPAHIKWFVAAGTRLAPEHWLSKTIGDGMVRPSSARGEGLGTPAPGVLPGATTRVFSDTTHIALMNDPAVLSQVLQWLRD